MSQDSAATPRSPVEPDPDIELAARIARWTDGAMIDPIVGLVVPGLGDIVGAGLGLYIVALAVRKRVPRIVVARMLLNLGIDAAVGAIPLAGDVFDFAFRANRRNVDLLQQRHAAGQGRPVDWIIVAGAALACAAALALPVLLLIWFVSAL
jgi:hypothetical protein